MLSLIFHSCSERKGKVCSDLTGKSLILPVIRHLSDLTRLLRDSPFIQLSSSKSSLKQELYMEFSLLLSILHYSFFFMAAALFCPSHRLGFAAWGSTFTKVASRELFSPWVQPWVVFLTEHLQLSYRLWKWPVFWVCKWASAAELIHIALSILLLFLSNRLSLPVKKCCKSRIKCFLCQHL